MKNLIKTLLMEWQEQALPNTFKRDVNIEEYFSLPIKKITAITGFRRVGKTYLVFDSIKRLLNKYSRKEILYLNFEDERIPDNKKFLSLLLPTIEEIFGSLPKYLFLDEIQAISGWSKWLRRIFDQTDIKIIVTGSSSKMSSQEIPTELRGRSLEIKVYPLSFKEFLRFKNIKADVKEIEFNEKKQSIIKYALMMYMEHGGMPEVLFLDDAKKREIIQQYYASVINRDIAERYGIRNELALRTLLQLLINSPIVSISSIYNNLKSLNIKIGKTTISSYLRYIENSYFIEQVPIFSYKIKDQMQYPRKLYLIDNGFINFLSQKFSKNYGRLFENLVFWEIRRRLAQKEIFYWQNQRQEEVDFVLKEKDKISELIQACYDLSDLNTEKREINSLVRAAKEFKADNVLMILNWDKKIIKEINGRNINIIPLWKWLLTN